MTDDELHTKLRRIRRFFSLREFDLTYWQMLSALGFPIPSRIEARWPREMNTGNPYKCGICDAKRKYPEAHVSDRMVQAAYDELHDDFTGIPLPMLRRAIVAALMFKEGDRHD